MVKLGSVHIEDRDIYEFGCLSLLSFLLNFAVTLIIGLIFGIVAKLLLVFVAFAVLRSLVGGYHAKTFWGCVLMSTVGAAVAVAAVKAVPADLYTEASAVSFALGWVVAFGFAPIVNSNHPLSSAEVVKFRKLARASVAALTVAAVAAFAAHMEVIGYCLALGVSLSSISTLASVITRRGEQSDA
jgi:accessory gene regulator B